jgi:hypothetical protein
MPYLLTPIAPHLSCQLVPLSLPPSDLLPKLDFIPQSDFLPPSRFPSPPQTTMPKFFRSRKKGRVKTPYEREDTDAAMRDVAPMVAASSTQDGTVMCYCVCVCLCVCVYVFVCEIVYT